MSDSLPSLRAERRKYQWYRSYDESTYAKTPAWEINRGCAWGQMDVGTNTMPAIGIYNSQKDDMWMMSNTFCALINMC